MQWQLHICSLMEKIWPLTNQQSHVNHFTLWYKQAEVQAKHFMKETPVKNLAFQQESSSPSWGVQCCPEKGGEAEDSWQCTGWAGQQGRGVFVLPWGREMESGLSEPCLEMLLKLTACEMSVVLLSERLPGEKWFSLHPSVVSGLF